jgi:hypothetical protein
MVADGSLVRRGLFRKDAVERHMATAPDGFAYKMVLLELWSRLYVDRLTVEDIADLARPVKKGRLRAVST